MGKDSDILEGGWGKEKEKHKKKKNSKERVLGKTQTKEGADSYSLTHVSLKGKKKEKRSWQEKGIPRKLHGKIYQEKGRGRAPQGGRVAKVKFRMSLAEGGGPCLEEKGPTNVNERKAEEIRCGMSRGWHGRKMLALRKGEKSPQKRAGRNRKSCVGRCSKYGISAGGKGRPGKEGLLTTLRISESHPGVRVNVSGNDARKNPQKDLRNQKGGEWCGAKKMQGTKPRFSSGKPKIKKKENRNIVRQNYRSPDYGGIRLVRFHHRKTQKKSGEKKRKSREESRGKVVNLIIN